MVTRLSAAQLQQIRQLVYDTDEFIGAQSGPAWALGAQVLKHTRALELGLLDDREYKNRVDQLKEWGFL